MAKFSQQMPFATNTTNQKMTYLVAQRQNDGATRYVIFWLVVLASFYLLYDQIFSTNAVCHENQFFMFNNQKPRGFDYLS